MSHHLAGKKIAILSTDGFEQSELFEPKKAMEEAGAEVIVVGLKSGEIKGWKDDNWGDSIKVDKIAKEAKAEDYDGLIIPGGTKNPDMLRYDENAVNFVKAFVAARKPIAAICHAPWLLIDAEAVAGKTITSWGSIRKDLENAGAKWVDKEVVQDGILITSRNPNDIPAFNEKIIEVLSSEASQKANA